MFDNVGGKIKKIAAILFGLSVAGSIIISIVEFSQSVLISVLILVIGIVVSYIQMLLLAAIGEIAENTKETTRYIARLIEMKNHDIASGINNGNQTVKPEKMQISEGVNEVSDVNIYDFSDGNYDVKTVLGKALTCSTNAECREFIGYMMLKMSDTEKQKLAPLEKYNSMGEPIGIKGEVARILKGMD